MKRKMKSPIVILSFLVLLAGCTSTTTKPSTLVEVSSADYGDTEYQMRIVELERNDNISKLKLTYKKMASSVGSSLFIMRGFCEVAKSRGTEYFTNLKEWSDKDGERLYIGGFTNKKNPNIQTEFGKEFSPTNEYGQTNTFLSVSQCDILWGNDKNIKQDTEGDAINRAP